MRTVTLLVAVLCIEIAVAYSTGAPPIACDSMTPEHGFEPQNTVSPYLVSVNPSKVAPGQNVIVKISKNLDTDYFEGFFAQARDVENKPLGKFVENEDYRVIDCGDAGSQNAATHNSHMHFPSMELVWTAPATPVELNFTFTIVRSGSTFWTGITVPLSVSEE